MLAVDRDDRALAALAGVAGVRTLAVDLETGSWPLGPERFGGVVVANYLHRPLFGALLAALADDGVLLYETFAAGNEAFGRPSNPAFLLQPGELLALCSGRLEVVAFEQGRAEADGGACAEVVVQRIAAVGRGVRAWPPLLRRRPPRAAPGDRRDSAAVDRGRIG